MRQLYKRVTFTIVLFQIIFSTLAFGQDDISNAANPWKKSIQFGLNFNQATFSKAWKGGGSNSISIGFLCNAKAVYTKSKNTWSNDLQMQYGFVNGQGVSGLRKSTDRLFFDSKYAHQLNKAWSVFGSLTFLSQFGQGLDYQKPNNPTISGFMAPGYMFESAGLEYKPVPYFNLQIGALTMRQTFVNSAVDTKEIPNNYGVEKGKTLLNEVGVQLVASFDKDVFENVNLKFRYGTMFAYLPKVKSLDHRLDLTTTARVNKFLNINFTLIGIYDDDIVSELQLSQGLAVGLLASF
jgi:hypothetical protein